MRPKCSPNRKYSKQILKKGAHVLRLATDKKVVKNALRVGLVVGTILNLINQGHLLIAPDFFQSLAYSKLILTYCVPYLVSTYSSVVTLREIDKKSTRLSLNGPANNPVASS